MILLNHSYNNTFEPLLKTFVHILILLSLIVFTSLKPIQHLIEEISLDVNMDENNNEENAEGKDIFFISSKTNGNEILHCLDAIKNLPIIPIGIKILRPSFTGADVLEPPELV